VYVVSHKGGNVCHVPLHDIVESLVSVALPTLVKDICLFVVTL